MTRRAFKKTPRADAPAQATWLAKWMAAASTDGAMSQCRASATQARGGRLEVTSKSARAAGVHLVLLTDHKGAQFVAASQHPFQILA